jgi:hypothetical protein
VLRLPELRFPRALARCFYFHTYFSPISDIDWLYLEKRAVGLDLLVVVS